MLEAYIRPTYQRLFVNQCAERLAQWPAITPNRLSLFSGVLGVTAALALALGSPWVAVALLLASGYADTLDGTLARVRNLSTPQGTVIDIMADRLVECAIVLGLFAVSPGTRSLGCLLMLSSIVICVTSFLVVGIFLENDSAKGFHYSPGLIERPEAFAFFITMMLIPSWFSLLSFSFALLVLYTAWVRVWQFYQCQT